MKLELLLLCCLAWSATANSRVRRIVGGIRAEEPPPPSEASKYTPPETEDGEPLVFVKKERRAAEVVGSRNKDGTYSFLGIRYAEPPIKRLRFVRPRRVKLKGLVEAKKFGSPCPQWFRGKLIGSEDCLFLNIYTPEIPSSEGGSPKPSHPVLIWIHGGNYKIGSAAQYVPTHLTKKGLVVVTIQYRLGSLGFLSLKRKELPGNVGLFDMALAVRWVKDYIHFFGGNPERIISGGQGSGASCVSHIVLNQIVNRNLKGIVAMSGTPVSPFALEEANVRSADEVKKTNVCAQQTGIAFVRCMQELSLDEVLKIDSNLEIEKKKPAKETKKLANLFTPGPVEEGKDDFRSLPNFVLESPLEAIKSGHFPNIPLLTGVTKQETGAGVKGNLLKEFTNLLKSPIFLTQDIFKDLLNANTGLYVNDTVDQSLSKLFSNGQYLQFFTQVVDSALSDMGKIIQHTTDALFNLPAFLFSNFWSKRSKVFLYSFEHNPIQSEAMNFLNGITLVSNQTSEKKEGPSHGDDLMYLFDIRTLEGELLPEVELSDADMKVRDHFTTAVVEFARTGTPKVNGGEAWAPFNTKDGNYMVIKEEPKQQKGFRKCTMGLWTGDNDLLGSTECAFKGVSEILTNTLGSASASLLKTAGGLNNTIGEVTGKVGDTLTKPLNPLGGIPLLNSNSNKKTSTQRPVNKGIGGLLGGLGK